MVDNSLSNINICDNACIINKLPDQDNICEYCHSTCELN